MKNIARISRIRPFAHAAAHPAARPFGPSARTAAPAGGSPEDLKAIETLVHSNPLPDHRHPRRELHQHLRHGTLWPRRVHRAPPADRGRPSSREPPRRVLSPSCASSGPMSPSSMSRASSDGFQKSYPGLPLRQRWNPAQQVAARAREGQTAPGGFTEFHNVAQTPEV